jgi:hypothetical protein
VAEFVGVPCYIPGSACGLLRIPLSRTRVNKGNKRKGRILL